MMSEAALVNFELYDNEDFRSPELLIEDEDGVGRDITGKTLRMQVRHKAFAPDVALLDLTIGAGIEVIAENPARIRIAIDREAIEQGYYYQDMIEEEGDLRTLLWVGIFSMARGVTRWSP